MTSTAHYFGYCTWLNPELLELRMPDAHVVGLGVVANHRVEFRRSADGAGDKGWCHLADGPETWGDQAYGVILEAPLPAASRSFDANRTRNVTVMGPHGPVDCWTYDLTAVGEPMQVPDYEWDHLQAGMRYWSLPDEYVKQVVTRFESAEPCPDPQRPDPVKAD